MASRLAFKPVTPARWGDFEALFGAKGSPNYCWCMAWRAVGDELKTKGSDRKPLMHDRIKSGKGVGLLAYLDGEPAAWVSVAPRETFRDLGGPEAEDGERIWSLTCLFVPRPLRGEGLSNQLVEAAIAYARKRNATALEAYPVDPESPSYRFMGFVPAFEKLGFEAIGKAGTRRHVMRITF